MKRKDKVITILGISVLMCSLFLVTIPVTAIAAEQDDYVLGVYGNANEDDTIDMRDLTYVKLIFFGKKPETELADAKYDGKINPLDFIQIKLIIVGKEKELTFIDSYERTKTVKKPIERIIVLSLHRAAPVRLIGAENKVVGVCLNIAREELLFPMMSKQPTVGKWWEPDPEAILALKPDIVIATGSAIFELEEKIEPYTTVVCLHFFNPENIVEDLTKLGYILDREDKAEEFIDWYTGYMDKIKDQTEGLSEEDKPRVYLEWSREYYCFGKGSPVNKPCIIAGGINIAADIIGDVYPEYPDVDPEWVVEQNPDIIIKIPSSTFPCGYRVDDITETKALWGSLMNRKELQNIAAVKNESIYVVCPVIQWGFPMVISTAYWAKWFHPGLFEDLDPQAIQKEYLTRFQRIDYDIDKHGVFVYPPFED